MLPGQPPILSSEGANLFNMAVIGCWQDGQLNGLQFDERDFEEARSLQQPTMTYVRSQLRGRLTARLHRAYRRWLHPTSGRRPGERFL